MSVKLLAELRPAGNFPVAETSDIQHGNKRLNTVLSDIETVNDSKADKTYVDSQLETKASTTALTEGLATKASTTALTEGLATKADDSTVSALSSRVSTNETNISNLSNYVTPEMFGAVGDGITDDTAAFINAINSAKTSKYTLLLTKKYLVSQTLNLSSGISIIGLSTDNTELTSTADIAFVFDTPAGSTEYQACEIGKFTLKCKNGIRFNDPEKDIIDGPSGQQSYIMRPYIHDLCLFDVNNNGNFGIMFVKTFDGTISRCYIRGFNYGIYFKGSDLNAIYDNRINNSRLALIYLQSVGTFGSGTEIRHNDLLNPSKSAIISSDRSVHIYNNYFESVAQLNSDAFIFSGGYHINFHENRIEIHKTHLVNQKLIKIDNENWWTIEIYNNFSSDDTGDIYFTEKSRKIMIAAEVRKLRILNNKSNPNFEINKNTNDVIGVLQACTPEHCLFVYGNATSTNVLFNYEEQCFELVSSGTVGDSITRMFLNLGSNNNNKITAKVKMKNADSGTLFAQVRYPDFETVTLTKENIAVTNEWKEVTLTVDFCCNYLALVNNNSNDKRILIKNIVCYPFETSNT